MELRSLFEDGIWYHCIRHNDLVSNGVYDIEKYLKYYGFDENYHGQTVLDVGCADGYFSLLMKERGADRVAAIDSNKFDGTVAIQPANFNKEVYSHKYMKYVDEFKHFKEIYEKYGLTNSNKLLLLAKLKGLQIEYHTGSVYDLSSYGTFDVVLCNDLLEHLRDPISAIEQVFFATRRKAIIAVSSVLKLNFFLQSAPLMQFQGHISGGSFYSISENALSSMCKAMGFSRVEIVSGFNMKNKIRNSPSYHVVAHAYK
jgi:2-polyprenyl-3-methyl-5-hydroxy-6-metoxy-1,4-benzoquinol methylase